MTPDLTHRNRVAEWMDEPDADPKLVAQSLRYIRVINRLFRYTRATVSHLEQFSRRWKPNERITIADLATGSADIPRAILRWADRRGFDVHVVGVDRHPTISREALRRDPDPRLTIVRGDALDLPFDDGSVDYAITNMFMHHLDEVDVVRLLTDMNRIARRGVVVADLERDRAAYRWISLFTLLANPMVRHDARVSVAQAFTRDEVLALRDRAGIGYAQYHPHFAYRFVLAGEKSL
ncbi:MAG TPA: methyltransferase domain-containing protein [Tepidisphaeraceae bacterium]|jgi:SAM-dependent methyltransferase|nr:methyltransferase domain-containing protein [Tepidisphaeraceae bacterium]